MSDLMHDGTPRSGLSQGVVGEIIQTRIEILRTLRELRESISDTRVTGPAARMERLREACIATDTVLSEFGMDR